MDVFSIYAELSVLYNDMLSLCNHQNDLLQILYGDAMGEEETDNVNDYPRLDELFVQRDGLEKNIDDRNKRLRQINIAPEALEKVNAEKAAIRELIIKIQEADNKNQQLIASVKNELDRKKGRLKKNQQAQVAYNPNFASEPWFLDSKK
ncbi:MAG: hypothetical protein LBK69_02880 [Syntrophomonadaceae bacterium]|jgi:hypothetical protein|nr:hypothetical protein [Syntrophomonadaceae bacterium]